MIVTFIILLGSGYYLHKENNKTVVAMINQQFEQALSMADNHLELLKQLNKTLINNFSKDHELTP